MMGYDTEFGQMECLRLMTESNFKYKKMGYLGKILNFEAIYFLKVLLN